MAGFAAALGGAAGPINQYGQQMREILEQRRDLFAQLAQKRATEETDPTMRDQWTQAAASALSGKDFGQILPKLIKAHDAHQQSTQALGQIAQAAGAGQQPTPAPPTGAGSGIPGGATAPDFSNLLSAQGSGPASGNIPTDTTPIPGISPGPAGQDFSALLANAAPQPAAPVAAQTTATAVPTTEGKIQAPPPPNPAPVALASAVPPVSAAPAIEGLPVPEDPNKIVQDTMTDPRWSVPANRPALTQAMTQRLSHQEALRQAIETKQTELAYKQAQLKQLKASPTWDKLPDFYKAALEAEAGGLAAPPMSGSMMMAHTLSSSLGAQAPPGTLEYGTNKPVEPGTLYDVKYIPASDQTIWQPAAPKTGQADLANGGRGLFNTQTGAAIAPLPGAVAPSQIAPIVGLTPNGAGITSAAAAAAGTAPTILPVTPPSMAGTQTTHSSVTSPSGVTTSETTVRKVAPAGAPVTGDQTPVPAMSHGAPAIPASGTLPTQKSVAPFNPTDRIDSLIRQIANGDTTLDKAKTNARDKFQIEERMAQLGLTPANITENMRERAKSARLILGHLDDIQGIINQAEKDGDLGVVATRWNDFLTNKLGDDPTKNQVFAKLSSQLGFLSTAVSMAHGGLRGGSSPTMVEHWEKALDAKDPTTLKAKLGEARKWMQGYSQLDQGLADTQGGAILPATGAGPTIKPLKAYTQADVDAAVKAGHGTAQDIDKAFKDKGYIKQ